MSDFEKKIILRLKKKKFSSYNYVNVVSTQCKQFNGLKIISMNKKLKKKKTREMNLSSQ